MFMKYAQESGPFTAYAVFKNPTFRENMSIPKPIWDELEPEIKEVVQAARNRAKAKLASKSTSSPPKATPDDTPLPSQYPSMQKSNTKARVNQLSAMMEDMDLDDAHSEGESQDDDSAEDIPQDTETANAFMISCKSLRFDDSDESVLQITANYNHARQVGPHFAYSDSGADTCVLGQMAGNIQLTGRYADLVGYDPANTTSPRVPIISGMVKVKVSETTIPVVLLIHQAAYIAHDPIALFSEYQVRDHGLIIDSTSKRHRGVDGQPGRQMLKISSELTVPMQDRGGLMGIEILEWNEGDEDRFEVFEITRNEIWKPRLFRKLQSVLAAPRIPKPDPPGIA